MKSRSDSSRLGLAGSTCTRVAGGGGAARAAARPAAVPAAADQGAHCAPDAAQAGLHRLLRDVGPAAGGLQVRASYRGVSDCRGVSHCTLWNSDIRPFGLEGWPCPATPLTWPALIRTNPCRRTLASPDFQLMVHYNDPCSCGSNDSKYRCCEWSVTHEQGGVLWPMYHLCECDNPLDKMTNPDGEPGWLPCIKERCGGTKAACTSSAWHVPTRGWIHDLHRYNLTPIMQAASGTNRKAAGA